MKTLKTKEGIKITYQLVNEMLIVYVDNYEYVIIDYIENIDDINLQNVVNWIEETYYSNDYLCEAYEPARFHSQEWRKQWK